MSGMEIVGWDPAEKQIRSWVFDSDGGFSEGKWSQKGNRWFIQKVGTLPDGGKSTATNIVTQVDDDSFTWQSTDRTVDDEVLPNVEEVLVKRAAGGGRGGIVVGEAFRPDRLQPHGSQIVRLQTSGRKA